MLDSLQARRFPAEWARDLTLWPYVRAGRSPLWIGVAIAAVFIAVTLGLHALMVALGYEAIRVASPSVLLASTCVNGALLGYLPSAYAYLYRGVHRDLRELRPVLRCSDAEFDSLLAGAAIPPAPARWFAGTVGALLGFSLIVLDPTMQEIYAAISAYDPRFVWFLLHNAAMLALGARLIAAEIHITRAYARIGEERVVVDLLDSRPLAPFARKGQRSVVVWALLSAIVSLYWVIGAAGRANILIPLLVVILITNAFLRPVAGVRRRIRQAKRAELARVHDALRQERERLLAGGTGESGRLADLIAYRSLVESARERPFDLPALARFVLFAALGVGSWLGGALVERLLDALLG